MAQDKQKIKTNDMTYIALMAVLICVCSWISLPAVVPFSLQTFGVFCALALLGGRRGSLAVLVYILMGAVGLPVFIGFTGGLGTLLGPTGGYILGFLVSALLYWLLEKYAGQSIRRSAAVLLLGLALCYAFGTAWYMFIFNQTGGTVSLLAALSLCVLPFVVPDIIKLALALILVRTLKKHIRI